MEVYWLAVMLSLLLVIFWIVSGFNPISPSVVSVSVYLASAILLALGPQSLNKSLSEYTVLIILLALFAFFIGEIVARLSFNLPARSSHEIMVSPIQIGTQVYLIILTFSLITLVWSYCSIKELAVAVGYREGEDLLIQYGRLAVLQKEMRPSMILTVFGFMLRALSYVLTFAYLYNIIVSRERARLGVLLLLPSVIYLLQYMLWGSRGGVIEYISFFVFIYAYFKYKVMRGKRDYNFKILGLSLWGLALFFLVFVGAGALKGWAGSNPFDIIAIYGGGSLSALDGYLGTPKDMQAVFGRETLLGFYSLFERVGIYLSPSSRILEFTAVGQTEVTNIYTSIRRYISDYGVLGMVVIQFFLGFLFSIGLVVLNGSRRIGYFSLLYATLFMALIYQALDEQALTTLFSTTQIFTVLFTFVFYKLLLKKKLEQSAFQISES